MILHHRMAAKYNGYDTYITVTYQPHDPYALTLSAYGVTGAKVYRVSRGTVLEAVRFRFGCDEVASVRLIKSLDSFAVSLKTRNCGVIAWLDIPGESFREAVEASIEAIPQGQEHLRSRCDWFSAWEIWRERTLNNPLGHHKLLTEKYATTMTPRCASCAGPTTADKALCERCR